MVDPKYSSPVLVVAPHPDDTAIMAGGSLWRLIQNGGIAYSLIVTGGGRGYSQLNEDIIEIRKEEEMQASKVIGYEPLFLDELILKLGKNVPEDLANERVDVHDNTILDGLIYTIREIKPSLMIVPFEEDSHQTHRDVYQVSRKAAWRASRNSQLELGEPHNVLRMLEAIVMKQIPDADSIVDITGEPWEKKKEALMKYKSQFLRSRDYGVKFSLLSLMAGTYLFGVRDFEKNLWGAYWH